MSTKHIEKSIKLVEELIKTNNPIIHQLIDSKNNQDITEIVAKKYSDDFVNLFNNFTKNSNVEQCLKLFDYIGVDPLKFVELNKSKLRMELEERPIEDLEYFLNFAKSKLNGTQIKSPLEFIEKITFNHGFHLLSVWSDEENKDIEKFKLLWISEQEYFKNQLIKNENLSHDSKLNTIEILKNIKIDSRIPNREWYRIQHHYFEEKDIKNIVNMAFYVELEYDLSNGTGKQQKKVKL